jgi:nicotinamide mononucleotide transporter
MEVVMAIIAYFSGTWGLVELAGTVFSLICVYLATKHNQWTWFFGILGILCFGPLFYHYLLYSDAMLQILFFLPMQVWGYMKWQELSQQSNNQSITLSLRNDTVIYIVLAIAGLTLINGYLMSTYTLASFAYADAWTTWMSVFAQVLMIRKYWQAWLLWIIMDIGAIYIYFAKGLFMTSGLYAVFLVLASVGLYRWYRNYKQIT